MSKRASKGLSLNPCPACGSKTGNSLWEENYGHRFKGCTDCAASSKEIREMRAALTTARKIASRAQPWMEAYNGNRCWYCANPLGDCKSWCDWLGFVTALAAIGAATGEEQG